MINNKNLSHANLLIGDEKTCLAQIKDFLSALKITPADRLDLSEAASIDIASARAALKVITLAPHSSPNKAVILPASRLNPQAAQALLKSIEEPPARTIWFLYAASEKSLPQTIVSRCRRIYVGGYRIQSLSPSLVEILSWPIEKRFELAAELVQAGQAAQTLDQWLAEAHTSGHAGLKLMRELLEIKSRLQSNANATLQLESFLYNLETQ